MSKESIVVRGGAWLFFVLGVYYFSSLLKAVVPFYEAPTGESLYSIEGLKYFSIIFVSTLCFSLWDLLRRLANRMEDPNISP